MVMMITIIVNYDILYMNRYCQFWQELLTLRWVTDKRYDYKDDADDYDFDDDCKDECGENYGFWWEPLACGGFSLSTSELFR